MKKRITSLHPRPVAETYHLASERYLMFYSIQDADMTLILHRYANSLDEFADINPAHKMLFTRGINNTWYLNGHKATQEFKWNWYVQHSRGQFWFNMQGTAKSFYGRYGGVFIGHA